MPSPFCLCFLFFPVLFSGLLRARESLPGCLQFPLFSDLCTPQPSERAFRIFFSFKMSFCIFSPFPALIFLSLTPRTSNFFPLNIFIRALSLPFFSKLLSPLPFDHGRPFCLFRHPFFPAQLRFLFAALNAALVQNSPPCLRLYFFAPLSWSPGGRCFHADGSARLNDWGVPPKPFPLYRPVPLVAWALRHSRSFHFSVDSLPWDLLH